MVAVLATDVAALLRGPRHRGALPVDMPLPHGRLRHHHADSTGCCHWVVKVMMKALKAASFSAYGRRLDPD